MTDSSAVNFGRAKNGEI